jgi:sirohydrochlorin cobaltochelatase
VTGLRAYVSLEPGWVSVSCPGDAMPQWLVRAITMENIAARRRGSVLDLPAAPSFRLETEIKNVVTVMAKTSHYWLGHIPPDQREAIGVLFAQMSRESPLVEPVYAGADRPPGWLAIQTPGVPVAVWMMRALVAGNVLSRREGSTLLVPLNPDVDPDGAVVSRAVDRVRRLAVVRGICPPNASAS